MATPLGCVPTLTSLAAWALVSRFRIETLPAELLVTTAKPKRGITATSVGVPAAGTRAATVPKVASGFKLIKETSAQPVLATTAMLRCSSMATPPGADAVPEHAGIGTEPITVKSVALETTPEPLTTSTPKRRGAARKFEGMVTSSSRLLTT